MSVAAARRVLFLGIGGSGMRGLAMLLKGRGKQIVGTDRNMEGVLGDSVFDGISLKPESLVDIKRESIDLIVHTDAIDDANELVLEAKKENILCLPYQRALGEVAAEYNVIAVAGTHGKSSTTSMLAHICIEAGLDPTVLVGAKAIDLDNKNARIGRGKYFILEADEYRNHYYVFHPQIALITAIDFDHPDFFSSYSDVERSFSNFLSQVKNTGTVIASKELIGQEKNVVWPSNIISVSEEDDEFELSVPGKHMRDNARLAVAAARQLGVKNQVAHQALKTWQGLARRFELLGRYGSLEIISDYGHHPSEIKATLAGARERYGEARILAILEPHTLERLEAFGDDFATALTLADGVTLVPTYRPTGRDGGNKASYQEDKLKKRLADLGKSVFSLDSIEKIETLLASEAQSFDVAIALSAGDLDAVLRKIVNTV